MRKPEITKNMSTPTNPPALRVPRCGRPRLLRSRRLVDHQQTLSIGGDQIRSLPDTAGAIHRPASLPRCALTARGHAAAPSTTPKTTAASCKPSPTRHRIVSHEYFDRGGNPLRGCNMKCGPMSPDVAFSTGPSPAAGPAIWAMPLIKAEVKQGIGIYLHGP